VEHTGWPCHAANRRHDHRGGRIVKLGSLAQYILDRRIPLEMCLSSNVHTGAVRSMQEHPFKIYYDRGFR
jgi:adenosine deaminase